MKKRLCLALFYGGRGTEHQISVLSKRYLSTLLNRERYEILDCFIGKNGKIYVDGEPAIPLISESALSIGGKRVKIDAALPIMHGDFGEDGRIQALLELMNTAYIGCDSTAGAVAFDKVLTKRLCESVGIRVVPFVPFYRENSAEAQKICERTFGYPMFVKPARQGSSYGANVINCKEEFAKHYNSAYKYGGGLVLVEKCLTNKRELECAYLSYGDKRYISEVGEVLSHGFYSFNDKYTEGRTTVTTRADIPKSVRDNIREWVDTLAGVLGIRHISRFDFFLSDGEVYLNEVNTMPGFTRTSLYPRLIEDMGIALPDMLDSLIADAMANHA